MSHDRLNCCVPFCHRTRKGDGKTSEWICGDHWPLVSPHLRKRNAKLFRRYRRRFGDNGFWAYPAGSENRIEAVRLSMLLEKVWERCKRQAIEAGMGLR